MIAQVFLLVTLVWAPVPRPRPQVTHLDLSSKANHSLTKLFYSKSYAGNHLGSLTQGKLKLAGVSFFIGQKMILTRSQIVRDKPAKVEGIPVGHRFTKLHFLHASSQEVPKGFTVGHYVVHYSDNTQVSIPLVFGQNVRDWWHPPKAKGVAQGAIAWRGTNKAARSNGKEICLYRVTWNNPHPMKVVSTIDLVSRVSRCSPFCVAMTTER